MKARFLLLNFASMASLRLGSAALTFGLFWLLSHRLNAAQLGGFSLLMNIFFLVQTLPLLGMTMPLMRRIAAHPESAAAETSTAFFFSLPNAAVIGLALAITGRWFDEPGMGTAFDLLGLSMLATAWTVVAEYVLMGQEQLRWFAAGNLLEALGRFLGTWAVIHWGAGLAGIFAVFAGLRFIAAFTYLLNRHVSVPTPSRVDPQTMKRYWREAPTYLGLNVVTALCTRIDLLLVARELSLSDAGIYAAASRLSDAALMLPTMAAVVIFPTQARLFESDRAAFRRFLESAARWCMIAGFAVALCVVAASPAIINLIYAPRLAGAAPILQILILGTTGMVIDQLLSTTMMAAHSQHADLRSMTLGLVVLVILFFVFTHFYGFRGAAMAAPAAILARVSYRLHWAQRIFESSILWTALRIVACAGAAVSVFFLHLAPATSIDLVLSLSTYAVLLYVTGAVQAADLRALRTLIGRRPAVRT